jgi:hypothetical protein
MQMTAYQLYIFQIWKTSYVVEVYFQELLYNGITYVTINIFEIHL